MDISSFTSILIDAYNGFIYSLPPFFQNFFNLFFLALMVFVYAVFIWKLHRFIARKDIIELDLSRYNTSKHPFIIKTVEIVLYFFKYIIVLPFIIFFWFAIFCIFLIFLTDLEISSILLISAVVVAAIRITSYYRESTAREISKLLPLTLLATFVLGGKLFSFEEVLASISTIPSLFGTIMNYLLFIIILEIILRVFELLFSAFGLDFEEHEN